MNLHEAQVILRDDAASYTSKVQAGWTIADSPHASLGDLLECMKHGGQIAEAAAITLYKRTKRPRASEELSTFVIDANDWEAYLRQNKLL